MGDVSKRRDLPLPSLQAVGVVQRGECGFSNEPGERRRENVARVQNTNTSCDLLACIEEREQVESTWIVRSFSNTEEKSNHNEASIVVGEGGTSRDNGPCHHADTHVDRWSNFLGGHEHVRRDLH